jgi:two-component system chemotaxis response regulator CheB
MNGKRFTVGSGRQEYELIVVGASLGGVQALQTVLAGLPADFRLPVAVVQHRASHTGEALAQLLQQASSLRVLEVEDKQAIQPGHVYLAPADYHLLVEGDHFALSTEAPVNYARPSIDVLFESAADTCGERTIGVILTGGNEDGARGLAAIKGRGGLAVVQAPETAEARAMPEAAIAAVAVDEVLPPGEIGRFLVEISVKRNT